jgi:hypothetical protein
MDSANLFRDISGQSRAAQDGKPEAVDVTGPGGGTVKGQTKEEAAAAKAASEERVSVCHRTVLLSVYRSQ